MGQVVQDQKVELTSIHLESLSSPEDSALMGGRPPSTPVPVDTTAPR